MEKKLNTKVLVTGGAGFIGSHLVDKLLSEGLHVVCLDNLSNGSCDNLANAMKNEMFKFIEGDILDKETCAQVMEGVEYVFHLACLGVRHSIHSPFENHRVNAEGTLNVLESSRKYGVKHFFYISTSEIYGGTVDFPITEKSPTLPLTVYGASKLAGEHYTNAFHICYGMKTTVFRIFNNYGPRAHYEGDAGEIIPRSIVRILYKEHPIIFGDGMITRDFFYVKDTAAALAGMLKISSAEGEKLDGKTINIGTGKEITMKELIQKLLQVLDCETLGIQYLSDRPADVPRLWVNADQFYSLTGFKSKYSFEAGLEETVAYYKEAVQHKNLLDGIVINNWEK